VMCDTGYSYLATYWDCKLMASTMQAASAILFKCGCIMSHYGESNSACVFQNWSAMMSSCTTTGRIASLCLDPPSTSRTTFCLIMILPCGTH
jgi:hypothetical protein